MNLKPRPQIIQPADPSYRIIPLSQGQVAKVDASDYEWLSQWKWHAWWNKCTRSFYALRQSPKVNGKQFTIRMHRVIMRAPIGKVVDHWNHDTLDNRRSNLRVATTLENNRNRRLSRNNSSGFPGVHYCNREKKWVATIQKNGKTHHVGYASTAEGASVMREAAALAIRGRSYCFTGDGVGHDPEGCSAAKD